MVDNFEDWMLQDASVWSSICDEAQITFPALPLHTNLCHVLCVIQLHVASLLTHDTLLSQGKLVDPNLWSLHLEVRHFDQGEMLLFCSASNSWCTRFSIHHTRQEEKQQCRQHRNAHGNGSQ